MVGNYNKLLVYIVLGLLFSGCFIFQRGYDDENEQYRPKRPHYKLKDKYGIFPKQLDTNGIYRLASWHDVARGLLYPKELTKEEYIASPGDDNTAYFFVKFYPKGRCLFFYIEKKDSLFRQNHLKESDLNPNNRYYIKSYYWSDGLSKIKIETFIYGEGTGLYATTDYYLNETGDTLIEHDKYKTLIYVREPLPATWKKYEVDW